MHAMRTSHDARSSGVITPPYSTSALDGGEWSPSHPDSFTPDERVPPDRRMGGSRAGLDAVKNRKPLVPAGNRSPIPLPSSP
jgi:hypothetical protein